jgi:hypothetical protein
MTQVTFEVEQGQRLQIGLSSGYDPKIVASAMLLLPISIGVVRYSDTRATLLVKAPLGIHVDVMNETDSHLPYYANPHDNIYSRLYVPRREGKGIVLLADTATIEEDLEYSTMHKWVIRPLWNNSTDKPFELFVGCYRTIEIVRSEKRSYFSAYDPSQIPAHMTALLTVLENEIPQDGPGLRKLTNQLRNTRDLFVWYGKKLLTDDTQERVKTIVTKIDNYLEEVQCSANIGSNENNRIKQALIDKMGPSWTEAFFNDFNSSKIAVSDADDILQGLEAEDGFDVLSRVLVSAEWQSIPINQCNCGGNAALQNAIVNNNEDSKELFFVECEACGQRSKRHDWGIACQTIASWNAINGEYQVGHFPKEYALEGMKLESIHKRLKSLNKLITVVEERISQLSDQRQLALSAEKERLREVKVWNAYIRAALKQSRVNGKSIEGSKV